MKIKLLQPKAIFEQGQRANQEDAIFPALGNSTELDNLFIVCDGMGGHEKGEVASNTVCTAVTDYLFQHTSPDEVLTDEVLNEALEQAFLSLDRQDDGSPRKMGTTLTLVYFHKGGCTIAHIGDSRVYHIRPRKKKILYKSRDHSLVYELYLCGEIDYEMMKTHPKKNIVTKAMMPGRDNRTKATIAHVTDIMPGDYFYLCSDGMLENMDDPEILRTLAADCTNEEKRQMLIETTKGNSDNHSAYIIEVDQVTRERDDDSVEFEDNEKEMLAKSVRVVLPGATAAQATETIVQPVQARPAQPMPQYTPQPQPVQTQSVQPQQQYNTPQPQPVQPRQPYYQPEPERKKRSMWIPMLTTVALLLSLLIVYFTCSGDEKKAPEEPMVEEQKPAKAEKDTFNIMEGPQQSTSTDLSSTTDQQKPEAAQKTEEKKKEEVKKEESPSPEQSTDTEVTPTPQESTPASQPATETKTETPVQQEQPQTQNVNTGNAGANPSSGDVLIPRSVSE